MLSPEELTEYRRQPRPKAAPHDEALQKLAFNTGGFMEQRMVNNARYELYQRLKRPRISIRKHMCLAHVDPDSDEIILDKTAGKLHFGMGYSRGGQRYLHPEEACLLMEGANLQMTSNRAPLSLMEAREKMLKSMSMQQYIVFSRLTRAGYSVRRTAGRTKLSEYQIRMNMDKWATNTTHGHQIQNATSNDVIGVLTDHSDPTLDTSTKTEFSRALDYTRQAAQRNKRTGAINGKSRKRPLNPESPPLGSAKKHCLPSRYERVRPMVDYVTEFIQLVLLIVSGKCQSGDFIAPRSSHTSTPRLPREFGDGTMPVSDLLACWPKPASNVQAVGFKAKPLSALDSLPHVKPNGCVQLPALPSRLYPAGTEPSSCTPVRFEDTPQAFDHKPNVFPPDGYIPPTKEALAAQSWFEFQEKKQTFHDPASSVLHSGSTKPLSHGTETAVETYQKLSIIKPVNERTCASDDKMVECVFDVFTRRTNSRRCKKSLPDARLSVLRAEDEPPSNASITKTRSFYKDGVPVLLAVVDASGEVVFVSCNPVNVQCCH